MPKFTINMSEVREIISNFYNLRTNVELVIEYDPRCDVGLVITDAPPTSVDDTQTSTADAEGWIEVDKCWSVLRPPALAQEMSSIEVRFRNGETEVGSPSRWNGIYWVQEGSTFDIVAYREAKQEDASGTWVKVPDNWKRIVPPEIAVDMKYVEVRFRDGTTSTGSPWNWSSSWSQDALQADIVEYRKAIKS